MFEKINYSKIIQNLACTFMSTIQAYDVKAKKKVVLENPHPHQMKNGTWAIKGTSKETGITLYKIVGNKEPIIHKSRLEFFKGLLVSRKCGCGKEY